MTTVIYKNHEIQKQSFCVFDFYHFCIFISRRYVNFTMLRLISELFAIWVVEEKVVWIQIIFVSYAKNMCLRSVENLYQNNYFLHFGMFLNKNDKSWATWVCKSGIKYSNFGKVVRDVAVNFEHQAFSTNHKIICYLCNFCSVNKNSIIGKIEISDIIQVVGTCIPSLRTRWKRLQNNTDFEGMSNVPKCFSQMI